MRVKNKNYFSTIAEGNVLKVAPGSPVAMAYAMIFGIDALLDMDRTACDVTGIRMALLKHFIFIPGPSF